MSLHKITADNNADIEATLNQGAAQDVATGAGSVQSVAFAADTKVVRLCATVACRYLIGTNPTALATSTLLPANWIELVIVPSPGTMKIAAIQEGSAGKLNITELT